MEAIKKQNSLEMCHRRNGKISGHPVPQFLICAAAVILLYSIFAVFGNYDSTGIVEKLMLLALAYIFIQGLIFWFTGRLTRENAIILIMAAGFVLRAGYMLYTYYTVRQHDVGYLGMGGHADYIYIIATTLKLPDTNAVEFYHPPLMYIFGAIVYKIASFFNSSSDFCLSAVKIIPCCASCATMIVSYRIFKNLKFSGRALAFATAIVCFHPVFIYLSASINNDMLSIFFFALAILYTIKWYKCHSSRNIAVLALSIGLGMMTKISVAVAAPAVAAVFIAALVKGFRSGSVNKLVPQYFLFGAISLPLGLWYPIRNFILFNQPLGYVLRCSESLPIYCGNRSIYERFFSFPLFSQLLSRVFGSSAVDCNIYIFTLKSALFGEWTFTGLEAQALVLSVINLIIVAVSLLSMIYVFACGKDPLVRFAKYFLGLVWFVQIAFFVKFNIDYPFGCTMDFRYIVITLITGAAFIGIAYDIFRRRHEKLAKPAGNFLAASVSLFCIASAFFYVCV